MKLITTAQLREPKGILTLGDKNFPCALGPAGMVEGKKEGDGGTPIAAMRLLYGFYRPDKVEKPQAPIPFTPITPQMGWCDAPDHAQYNKLVDLPFAASHEKMWRDDHLYDICIVLDWNIDPATPGKGSAIFFHLAHDDYRPTEGCIALSRQDMSYVLNNIENETILETVLA